MLAGFVTGVISSLGFRYLSDLLRKIKLHDTCGIHNLHALPGVIGGVVSAIVASQGQKRFGNNFDITYGSSERTPS